jgi:hypothetical protein
MKKNLGYSKQSGFSDTSLQISWQLIIFVQFQQLAVDVRPHFMWNICVIGQ